MRWESRMTMSYDIRIAVETVYPDRYGEKFAVVFAPEYDSPTYNVGNIFRKVMDWDFKQGEWYPLNEVFEHIDHGIGKLRNNFDAYRDMEPENKWGTVETVWECLTSWRAELEDPWGVTGNWGIEHLWWRW